MKKILIIRKQQHNHNTLLIITGYRFCTATENYFTIFQPSITIYNMKISKKLLGLLVIIIVLIIGIGGYLLYNSRLQQSKEEGKKIVSRAVTDPKWQTTNKTTPSETKNISPVVNQPQKTQDKNIKTGQFLSLDPAHYAKGSVNIVENGNDIKVAFSQGFETNPDGPDLYVWLVKKQDIKNIALGGVSSDPKNYLDLGPLTAKSGSQAYQVTKSEFEANNYAVVIWCRAFGVQFSNAILK
jgi:hypothetical protein